MRAWSGNTAIARARRNQFRIQEAIIYSLLHCHFESALRALALAKPDRLQYVQAVYSSPAYRRAAPAERLTLLWRKVLSLTDNEDIFSELTFRQVVRRLLDEMRASRVEHIDLRIGPSIGRWRWMHSTTDGFDIFAEELTRYGHLSMAFLTGVNMTKSEDQLDVIFDMLFGDADMTARIGSISSTTSTSTANTRRRGVASTALVARSWMSLIIRPTTISPYIRPHTRTERFEVSCSRRRRPASPTISAEVTCGRTASLPVAFCTANRGSWAGSHA